MRSKRGRESIDRREGSGEERENAIKGRQRKRERTGRRKGKEEDRVKGRKRRNNKG